MVKTINTPTGGGEGGKTKKSELIDEKKNEVSEALDIPHELKDYREAWERCFVDGDIKDKIIAAANKIPVKMEKDSDGSRLVEFKLGNKTYKILDPVLENHTDDVYRLHRDFYAVTKVDRDEVTLGGMVGDDVNNWKNQKLKSYVKQKQLQGLYIPTREEIDKLLDELGEETGLTGSLQSALLMYLTGMDGCYWIGNDRHVRSGLNCAGYIRGFFHTSIDHFGASLCMISGE